MTKTLYDTDTIEHLDFDPSCMVDECDQTPVWKTLTKCCGAVMLFCDPHLKEALEWGNSGGLHACPFCQAHNLHGNPFSLIERL